MGKRSGEQRSFADILHIWLSDPKVISVILVILTGSTAYHFEPVKRAVHGKPPPTVEEIQPVQDGHLTKSVEDIVSKIKRIDAEILKLKQRDNSDQSGLQIQIDALKKWHE